MKSKILESYYKTNHILAKSVARKLYRHIKVAAIELLEAEAKRSTGRAKIITKHNIKVLNENL